MSRYRLESTAQRCACHTTLYRVPRLDQHLLNDRALARHQYVRMRDGPARLGPARKHLAQPVIRPPANATRAAAYGLLTGPVSIQWHHASLQ